MGLKTIKQIEQSEIKAKGVTALADRPNVASTYGQSGLSPSELKAWFDNIGNILKDKINKLLEVISGEDAKDYIAISGLGSSIASLGDLTASFLNGSFATILMARARGGELGTLQTIIDETTRDIWTNYEAFTNYKALLLSNAGADNIGISDDYNGAGKKLSNLVSDIANGLLAAKLSVECFGFDTATKETPADKSLQERLRDVESALRGELNTSLLEKIIDRYTKTETDNLLAGKVDNSTYNTDQTIQDGRLDSVEDRATAVEENVGDMDVITRIFGLNVNSITAALESLNEDVDSLQNGIRPRIMRGMIYDSEPSVLDDELIAALNNAVYEATGRTEPDLTDAIKVMDNAMPDAGYVYTYYYWKALDRSETDGWYLADYYTTPTITEIPTYVFNILSNSWTSEPDSNGLYYITIPPAQHGMGKDMSLYVDLRRAIDDENFTSLNLFYVTVNGTIIVYSDEKFTGKVIVRVGRAYYTANTQWIEQLEIEQVNGLVDALNSKVDIDHLADTSNPHSVSKGQVGLGNCDNTSDEDKPVSTAQAAAIGTRVLSDGGDIGETVATFPENDESTDNIASGSKTKTIFGRIRAWFARLGALAFKSKVKNADVADDAAIAESKIDGLTSDLAAKVNKSGGDIKDTVVTFDDDTSATRTNISSGDTAKGLFGKIKRWFGSLGGLAFKDDVRFSGVDDSYENPINPYEYLRANRGRLAYIEFRSGYNSVSSDYHGFVIDCNDSGATGFFMVGTYNGHGRDYTIMPFLDKEMINQSSNDMYGLYMQIL